MQCGKFTLDFSRTLIMGVLNVTPDSFSDGGQFFDVDKAVAHAKKMVAEGADIIDIGGESTRPSSEPVSEEEEIQRVLPVIESLVKDSNVPLSIDSCKPKVVDVCCQGGASMINDVTGLRNDEMVRVAASHDVPVVVMHMQGQPKSMQANPVYDDVVQDIKHFFQQQIKKAKEAAITKIILDPGIGFGKTVEHNLQLLQHAQTFTTLGCPLLIGASRKSFLGKITGREADERLEESLAANTAAILHGANIIRVHDVKEAKRAAQIADAIKNA